MKSFFENILELRRTRRMICDAPCHDITFGIRIGKKTVPWHFTAHWQRQKIVPGLDVDDAVEVLLRWRPQDALRENNGQRKGNWVKAFIQPECFQLLAFFFNWQLDCTINRQMGKAAHGVAPPMTSLTGIYSLNCYWLVKLVKFCSFKNMLQWEEPRIWKASHILNHTTLKMLHTHTDTHTYLGDNLHLGTRHRERCFYPKCDWAGPGSVSQERLAYWTTSLPGCNPLTRCLWTWYNPDRQEPQSALQRSFQHSFEKNRSCRSYWLNIFIFSITVLLL